MKPWCSIIVFLQIYAFGKAGKTHKPSSSRSNVVYNVIFSVQSSLRVPTTFKKKNSKFDTMYRNLIQKLTRRKISNFKSCFSKMHGKCKNHHFFGVASFINWLLESNIFFKVWYVFNWLHQNLSRRTIVSENLAHHELPIFQTLLVKKGRKLQNLSFSREAKQFKTGFFECFFFQILTLFDKFRSKSEALWRF